MFHEESKLVQIWVRLVQSGTYNRKEIPKIDNLREVVETLLDDKS